MLKKILQQYSVVDMGTRLVGGFGFWLTRKPCCAWVSAWVVLGCMGGCMGGDFVGGVNAVLYKP